MCAAELQEELGLEVSVAGTPKLAVNGANIVLTTTPFSEPLVEADWLQPGQYITAMGSDQDHKGELDPACLAKADLYVPDHQSQTRKLDELRSPIVKRYVAETQDFAELGDVIVSPELGRRSEDQITIVDLTGTGVQNTVIATLACQRAAEKGLSMIFRS